MDRTGCCGDCLVVVPIIVPWLYGGGVVVLHGEVELVEGQRLHPFFLGPVGIGVVLVVVCVLMVIL